MNCPGLVVTRFRRHISTSSLNFIERKRVHLGKMTVPADSIVKTFALSPGRSSKHAQMGFGQQLFELGVLAL